MSAIFVQSVLLVRRRGNVRGGGTSILRAAVQTEISVTVPRYCRRNRHPAVARV